MAVKKRQNHSEKSTLLSEKKTHLAEKRQTEINLKKILNSPKKYPNYTAQLQKRSAGKLLTHQSQKSRSTKRFSRYSQKRFQHYDQKLS